MYIDNQIDYVELDLNKRLSDLQFLKYWRKFTVRVRTLIRLSSKIVKIQTMKTNPSRYVLVAEILIIILFHAVKIRTD